MGPPCNFGFNHKTNEDIAHRTDEPWKDYANWKMINTKETYYMNLFIWNTQISKSIETKVDWELAVEGREEEGGSSNGYVMLHGGEPTKSHTEKEQILWYMYYISVF